MPERIVVCLSQSPDQPGLTGPDAFLEQARALLLRAKAFGASLCAWSWSSLAFSFQGDDLEEAVGFVVGGDAQPLVKSFRIGVASGDLQLLADDGHMELGWGEVLHHAMEFSLLAKPGEVLVDCDLLAVHSAKFVTRATRSTRASPPKRAGVIAALAPACAGSPSGEQRPLPPLQGRQAMLDNLRISPGNLVTLRAAPGFGGTRFLAALADRSPSTPRLIVHPTGYRMEPLGALRRAVTRARNLGVAPELPEEAERTWLALSQGLGADPEAAAEMIEAWLSCPDPDGGLLLIDDANDVDGATLDAIATALLGAQRPFRAIARLDRDSPLPAELAPLPPGPEIELAGLPLDDAVKLLRAWTGNTMSPEEARTWAARTNGIPLAIGESIAEGLATGQLASGQDTRHAQASPRPRSVPPPAPTASSPSSLIARRLRFLTPGSRATLFALATLGGDAPCHHVLQLTESSADVPVDLELEQERLSKSGWISRPEPGWLALPTRTHLRVIRDALPETRRATWHRCASTALESSGNLEMAEAAWHAVASKDRPRAQRIAKQAATLARVAGLENAARDLEAFARAHDPFPMPRIESDPSGLIPRLPMASSPGDPEDIFPVALAARGPRHPSRFAFPPVAISDGDLPAETDDDSDERTLVKDPAPIELRKRSAARPPSTPPGTVRRPKLELLLDDDDVGPSILDGRSKSPSHRDNPVLDAAPPTIRQATIRDSMGSIHELTQEDRIHSDHALQLPPEFEPEEDPDSERTLVQETSPPRDSKTVEPDPDLEPSVVRILRSGSADQLLAWANQTIEASPDRSRIVQRVRAVAELRRGKHADAVRILRNACQQSQQLPPIERSRSRLAFAIGLAESGRSLEALLESLDALARAREAGDRKAEVACLTFLQKLYEDQGKEVAGAWRSRHA